MAKDFTEQRYLIAFDNGSYKKVKAKTYDHKEWIVITKEDGSQVFVNPSKVKYIETIID